MEDISVFIVISLISVMICACVLFYLISKDSAAEAHYWKTMFLTERAKNERKRRAYDIFNQIRARG